MLKITLKNGEKTLPLDRSQGISLLEVSGLEPVKAQITTQQNVGMSGLSVQNRALAGRTITIQLAIEGIAPQEVRRKIYEIATPMSAVDVLIDADGRHYKASGYVENLQATTWAILQRIQLDFLCPGPYLEAPESVLVMGSNTQKKFSFPFHTDKNSTDVLYFGEKLATVRAVIQYKGEVQTGAIFTIIANSDLKNPKITNLSTGEVMGITGTLEQGADLIISTEHGKKSLTLRNRATGEELNALKYKDAVFDWCELVHGENIFILQAESGVQSSIFTVEYTERYVGV